MQTLPPLIISVIAIALAIWLAQPDRRQAAIWGGASACAIAIVVLWPAYIGYAVAAAGALVLMWAVAKMFCDPAAWIAALIASR